MAGAGGLSAVNFIAGALYEAARAQPEKASQFAPAAVCMLFLFNLCYAATWGTVAFLIPTEIWSSDMRAQGNGFGITGWAIGVGWTVLVNPIMFSKLENRTYFLFAGLNLLWVPIVYLCKSRDVNEDVPIQLTLDPVYPETADRSLESIDVLFSTAIPFSWKMEQAYREHGDILAERGLSVSSEGTHDKSQPLKNESLVV